MRRLLCVSFLEVLGTFSLPILGVNTAGSLCTLPKVDNSHTGLFWESTQTPMVPEKDHKIRLLLLPSDKQSNNIGSFPSLSFVFFREYRVAYSLITY
jgi:hypothetical protein